MDPSIGRQMFERTVDPNEGHEGARGEIAPLPLNLVALIISFLDDPGDLSRTCRTCRVLYYMTLPQLYSSVSLHAYDYIKYSPVDGRPEGCGGGSPFTSGLNALATRNVTGYVKEFRVWGKWKEHDLEECSKLGRVPDGSMMLNSLIRAVVDRMPVLEHFSWELDTKMLPTVWQGLAQKKSLLSLTVRFPDKRIPRPMAVVPPIPSLRSIKITNIDPLCYPDDISLLLLGSKMLSDLKLHWSPRMRRAREPSVILHSYFGKVQAAGYRLPCKSVSVQNVYTHNKSDFTSFFDPNTMKELTFFNSHEGADDDPGASFIDDSWKLQPPSVLPNLKMVRGDSVSRTHCNLLGQMTGIERYYCVTGREPKIRFNGTNTSTKNGTPSTLSSTCSEDSSSLVPTPEITPSESDSATALLGKFYLDNICKNHGTTLSHLLLRPEWRLTSEELARLVRSCPNLEQLGIGISVELATSKMLHLMIPFLSRLFAIRILDPADDHAFTDRMNEKGDEWQEQKIGDETWESQYNNMKWVGLGDLIYEISGAELIEEAGEGHQAKYRRVVKRRPYEAVKDIEIWSMDRLEI